MTAKVPSIRMANGENIPAFGLGTWQSEADKVAAAVKAAIKLGYRHIDTAICYENQKEIGCAIAEAIKEGLVKREDLFLTSKIWNTYHSYARTHEALNLILTELGVQYMDLILIHWPQSYAEDTTELFPLDTDGNQRHSNIDFVETWKALREAVQRGLVKSIGVSNFNHKQIQRIIDAYPQNDIPIVTNQVELHPYFQQKMLTDFCKSKNILITAYSPLSNPSLARKDGQSNLLHEPKLEELCKKYSKTSAQVVLRWFIQKGIIVIPKSVNLKRLAENIDIFDFHLDDQDVTIIESLDRNMRLLTIGWDVNHPEYPFHEEF